MEQIGQDGCGRSGADQALGLEGLHVRLADPLGLGVEQPAPRPADAIGRERLLELLALQQDREAGQRAFGGRRAGERSERRP